MTSITTENIKVLVDEVITAARALKANQKHAVVIKLEGDLGAGKTTFTKALCEELGATSRVQSPTFVIERRYELADQDFNELIHIDAYRLKDNEDQVLQFEELKEDQQRIIVVEWPEKMPTLHTLDHFIKLTFEVVSETEREVTVLVQ